MKKLSLVLNVVLVILVIFLALKLINKPSSSLKATIPDETLQKYQYLSKRVLIENQNDILIHFVELRRKLREAVAPYKDSFAFYFEYLSTGTSIGVNEKSEFQPASLGKVPLAMALYQNVEQGSLNLKDKIKIKPENINANSGDLWKKGVGTEMTVEEAVEIMLKNSDNTAAAILADYVNEADYKEVYSGLDLVFPGDNDNKITPKGYSSIIKALYFASVLNKDDSEKILDLLTKSQFKDKLVAGVPGNIPVAHKIGFWREDLYSDCGIVYIPKRPYLLCMFSQTDESEAKVRMKTVSEIIYQYISLVNAN